MKVCIVTTVHSPFDVRIFHKEAKSLVAAGYDVTLIARNAKNEIVDGVKIVALPNPKNRFYRMTYLGFKAFNLALKQKADIYHFHDPELLPWMSLLKKSTRAKVIYDVHEDVPKQIISKVWLPVLMRTPLSRLFNSFEKQTAKLFDAIITVTPEISEKFSGKNVICLANYPKLDYFKQFPANNVKKNNFTAIYAGGLSEIRGIEEIIEAFLLIPSNYGIDLALAGPFMGKSFENKIKSHNGWGKINYLGNLPIKDAYKKMAVANVGLVCFLPAPNHIKALPNKIFEYMAAGIPVIASNFPLWKNIIEKSKCGICIDPNHPKEIAEAIIYIKDHPKEANIMGGNGKIAIKELYNWERENNKLLSLYKNL